MSTIKTYSEFETLPRDGQLGCLNKIKEHYRDIVCRSVKPYECLPDTPLEECHKRMSNFNAYGEITRLLDHIQKSELDISVRALAGEIYGAIIEEFCAKTMEQVKRKPR